MAGYLNSIVFRGAMVVAALAVAPTGAVHAANLEGVRVWAGPEYTRVVIDATGPLHYKIRQKGGEVLVDLPDSGFSRSFSDPAAQGLLRGMSHARIGKNLQLTAKVHPDSHLKSFVLEPRKGDNYRLVLDLYPDSATADRVVTTAAAPKAASEHSSRASTQQAAALLNGQRAVVVAIDAGHGGKDSGAHGPGGTQEKNVTLAVARDLAAMINRQPGMKAVLTRNSDFYIPLKQRYKIARENNADLFVSIHADSFTSDDAKGSSVWVLSPRGKTSEAARWLADRENRADLIGGTTLDDKDDGLAKVLLDLQQGWAMQASDVVAGNVLKALAQLGPTHRGYVEKANFVVLRSPDVPSILVETAFISNPKEERKLRDPAHQKRLAAAVMGGVKNYFESTPPPGTWFAAQAAQRSGVQLASTGKSTTSSSTRADAGVRDLHKVNRGESLGSIARQYGVSVSALKNANQMSSDTVRAGVMLAIPTS
ncbi:N-acetylmuramoyl-L-alanine amidase [Rhodanobacter sp. Root627]|uniref:N-acetylmuramoyl-L-alanine amidase family protein n=1 Tax=Rhodanobacter sp. Root627 TaxID=1736572 RepID=UPI0006F90C62|nr:N-acetylmuramoyl-L-alanine amidase [Rhodanobacter sp. Root627]KRA35263.1 N-acetylmuramoyl-L-alanine amidase [Rhodanobacter sp. Root627]